MGDLEGKVYVKGKEDWYSRKNGIMLGDADWHDR